MHLLFITETYPPEINGVARTLQQMALGLCDLGHRVTLLCPGRDNPAPSARETRENLRICRVRGLPLPGYAGLQFGLPARGLIRRVLRETPVDAVYIATEGPLGYSAVRACTASSIPVLSGLHTNFHQYSRYYGAKLLGPLLLGYMRHFHNRLDGTLVPTREMARALAGDGFERLHIWPRGVDTQLFDPRRRDRALRARWGLTDEDTAVIYVGRLAAEKNIGTAFEAFAAVEESLPKTRFVLVGEGPAEARLRAEHPEALFTGPLSGVELATHYASADIFLFPSTTDTFGNVTLEAMASGLAVVAYDLAAAHELIDHGRNGLLADVDVVGDFSALAVSCATAPDRCRQLKLHARETALQQDWPTLIQALEQLFITLCNRRNADEREESAESVEHL